MSTTKKKQARPANLRESSLYSAGMYAGMRNYAMARAASASGNLRSILVKAAREFHHTHLARLYEAQAATWGQPIGYYVPKEIDETPARCDTETVPVLRMMVRQAGGL